MPAIMVNSEALQAIRAASDPLKEFKDTSRASVDGLWELPVDYEVVNRLREVGFAGESLSDTIIRLAAGYQAGGRTN